MYPKGQKKKGPGGPERYCGFCRIPLATELPIPNWSVKPKVDKIGSKEKVENAWSKKIIFAS